MALTDNLVEFWTLNNTLTGINGNTLVSPDGLTHYVAGKLGQAWDPANAADRVLKKEPGPINPGASNWSLSLWFWTESPGDTTAFFQLRDGTTSKFRVDVAVGFRVTFGSSIITLKFPYEEDPETGEPTLVSWVYPGWNHIVLTFERDTGEGVHTLRGWANGVLDTNSAGVNISLEIPNLSVPNLDLGGRSTADSTAAYAYPIDAVGWWSRKLTDDEIADLYNSGAGWEPTIASVVTNILWGSTPDQSRILNSRIVRGMM
jgi:hypothetical protein